MLLRAFLTLGVCLSWPTLSGCAYNFSDKAQYGVTFYCPGAGNFDFGDAGVREGLEASGYKGEVATYLWTISFNPAIDQTLRLNARLRAGALADVIEYYIDRYPGQRVNLVGLSAGTGIVIWALEDLKPGYKVDDVVLLGSSLWHKYDVRKALAHVKGRIYNYHSAQDAILAGPMKVVGTIDGVFGEDGAGSVGLHPPGRSNRVVNIPWKPEFATYGYYGGHTDATSPAFVRAHIARHIIGSPPASQRGKELASRTEPTPADERTD